MWVTLVYMLAYWGLAGNKGILSPYSPYKYIILLFPNTPNPYISPYSLLTPSKLRTWSMNLGAGADPEFRAPLSMTLQA